MKRKKRTIAIAIIAVLACAAIWASAIDYELPPGSSVKTSRFGVMDVPPPPGAEFSMISADGELVIHIGADTLVYFEDAVPLSDDPDAGTTQMVREVLFGRTLAEVLDGRNMAVTYAIETRSMPPQTSPISVRVLFESIMPLPTEPTPLPDSVSPFVDVNADDWFYQPVNWAFQSGIMTGTSATVFAPDAEMTRAMLVTVLWRYDGSPDAGVSSFADVPSNTWYSTAVAWAAENDIVSGYNPTTFGVNDFVTREQMHTILYRYMSFAGETIKLDDEMRLQQFADEDLISGWAKEALYFMYDAGITFQLSSSDNYARPKEFAKRGEIAAAMYFYNMKAEPLLDAGQLDVEYIRTSWYEGKSGVKAIHSKSGFEEHFADESDVLRQFSDDFFDNYYLVIVSLEENSGSIRHRVDNVGENGEIRIIRFVPETGTADMAGWDIVIVLDKDFVPDEFSVVLRDVNF